MDADRVLLLEGVHNFRDFGGYSVVGGGRLKRGLLWRSGQHHGATEADLARIAALGLVTVFDLRSAQERTAHPCRRPAGFSGEVHVCQELPRPEKSAARPDHAAPHVAAAQVARQADAASTHERLMRTYGRIALRPALVEAIGRYLAVLAAGKGPSLVNCMAGKDRTGIAVAMAQLAAGVHRDDVIADYVLTNTAGDSAARIAAGRASVEAMTGPLEDNVLHVLMGVDAAYLESAFATIAAQYGSLDAYLAGALGADDALRGRLREALVEA